ncbi:phage tail fiber protein [Lacticaseibacillus casei A2-362]|nr:phage tail fiber protein [Lacticaseibacillus casei A2-362]
MKKEIAVKYGDFDLSPYFIVSNVTMPFLYKDNQYTQIGRSDGESLIYSRNAKTKITIQGTILTQETNLTVAETKDELINALKSDTVQQLTLSNYPGRYFNAIFDGSQDFDGTFDYIATVELVFTVPDGIAHSVATKTADNKDPKWNGSPLNLLAGTSDQETSATVDLNNWNAPSQHPNISVTSGQKFAYQIFITNHNTVDLTAGVDAFSGKAWKATYVGNVIKAGTSGYSSVTFTIPSGTDNIVANAARLVARVTTAKTTVYWQKEKLEVNTSVSPWSPNPADPEYYADTITVHNAGTYPSEPVITATINGDDGVLTAINDQGSVLQFGSPDETDGFVKQKSERVYHLDFNQTPTGVTLNNGVTAFPYYEHGNDANVQSGPFGYANGIAYPSTERTASNYWNGPSMSGTIPPNSNGSNTANFQFVNRVNVDTSGPEVGRFEFNLTYQGKIVASLALFDDSPANDQLVFSGTLFDGKDAKMVFFDLLPRNYYRGGNYNAVITKVDNWLTFRLDRLDLGDGGIEPVDIGGFPAMLIDGWTAWFPGFSDQRGWSINWQDSYFEWINVDYWNDIPNRFKDGDVVKIDVANRRVLVNGFEDRTLQAIGNDWGGFKIHPGNNTIRLLTSNWAKRCEAEIAWQEAWL